jgi:predicted methyltransferase
MTRRWMLAAAAVLVLAGTAPALALPTNVAAALNDSSRPAADQARDAARKAGETLELAGVRPDAKVADLIMGGGYFTRLLSAAVGAKGEVVAYQPAEFIQFRAAYGDEQKAVAAALANVKAINMSLGALDLPDGLDLVLTVQNYHDLHLTPFPKDTAAKVNAEYDPPDRSGHRASRGGGRRLQAGPRGRLPAPAVRPAHGQRVLARHPGQDRPVRHAVREAEVIPRPT